MWRPFFPCWKSAPCPGSRSSTSEAFYDKLIEMGAYFIWYFHYMPFNENMFQPCPMLENPAFIQKMVKETGARSTDLQSPESVTHLTEKTLPYAEAWKARAETLWAERQAQKAQTQA